MRTPGCPMTVILFMLPFALLAPLSVGATTDASETAQMIESGHSITPGPEESQLLSDLHDAKKAGEMSWARLIESELADLHGRTFEFGATDPVGGLPLWTRYAHEMPAATGNPWDDQDILVKGYENTDVEPVIACDSNGNLFAAFEKPDGASVDIRRSGDGGWTWSPCASFGGGGVHTDISLAVGDGNEAWGLLAFVIDGVYLMLFRFKLDCSDAEFVTIYAATDGISNPRIITDSAEYPAWYAHVVFNLQVENGWVVCSTKSLDYGATWQSVPQIVRSYCIGWDASEATPDIDFGSNRLYATFSAPIFPCDNERREIFVYRSTDFGGSWLDEVQLTSNDKVDFQPTVGAIKDHTPSRTAVIAYSRLNDALDYDVWYTYTQNGGESWRHSECLSCLSPDNEAVPDIETSFSQGAIHLAYWHDYGIDYATASYDEPWAWTVEEHINYGDNATANYPRPNVSVNPTVPTSKEVGIVWTDDRNYGSWSYDIYFDMGMLESAVGDATMRKSDLLSHSVPNPFSGSTTIRFDLEKPAMTELMVTDVSGRVIRRLAGGLYAAGRHNLTWDGTDESGASVSKGVYFLRLKAGEFDETRSVTVLR